MHDSLGSGVGSHHRLIGTSSVNGGALESTLFNITVAETCRRTKRVWLKSSLFTVFLKLLIKGT